MLPKSGFRVCSRGGRGVFTLLHQFAIFLKGGATVVFCNVRSCIISICGTDILFCMVCNSTLGLLPVHTLSPMSHCGIHRRLYYTGKVPLYRCNCKQFYSGTMLPSIEGGLFHRGKPGRQRTVLFICTSSWFSRRLVVFCNACSCVIYIQNICTVLTSPDGWVSRASVSCFGRSWDLDPHVWTLVESN